MPEITRTLAALIEQVDRRSMTRIKRAWKDDSVPVNRRPAMKRYLLHSERTSFQALLPFLRIEQLRSACQALRAPYGGPRDDLVTSVAIEGIIDNFELRPFSRKAIRVRKYLWERACSEEDICPDEALEAAWQIAQGEQPAQHTNLLVRPDAEEPAAAEAKPGRRKKTVAPEGPRGFAAVGGMEELKERLREEVIEPLRLPGRYRRYGLTIPNGILLHGPYGCGKSYLAERLAEEAGLEMVRVLPSVIGSCLIHETAQRIAALFAEAAEKKPSMLFFDEIDAMAPSRAHLDGTSEHKAEEVNELLAHLQGAGDRGILVVAATNLMSHLDPALLRPGRFDRHYHIAPPDGPARQAILELALANRPTDKELDLAPVVNRTAGQSCADLKLLVDDAARLALRADKPIGCWHLEQAASKRRTLV